jgi:DNA-binding MarR family transcriptional regulator
LNTPSTDALAPQEFRLVQALERRPDVSQRVLSHELGLSLGMTNLLLKRLARKGLLKAQKLDWNRTRYLLTYKGATEKARKSYAYALHAWKQARRITRAVQDTVIEEYRSGARRAAVVAWPETAMIIQGALAEKDLPGLAVEYHEEFRRVPADQTLLFAATIEAPPPPVAGRRIVHLLDKMDLEFRFDVY